MLSDSCLLILSIAANEGDILPRLRKQDPQALTDLYDLYGHAIFVLIERIVHNPALAEDLVQEAFLRVWNRASRLAEDQAAVGPWLFVVARNCALDYLRSAEQRVSAHSVPLTPESSFALTDTDLNNSERAALLREAFLHLSPSQKQVIELAYYEGLSQTEIAARIDRPLGTVKSLIRTALEKMRIDLLDVAGPRTTSGRNAF